MKPRAIHVLYLYYCTLALVCRPLKWQTGRLAAWQTDIDHWCIKWRSAVGWMDEKKKKKKV